MKKKLSLVKPADLLSVLERFVVRLPRKLRVNAMKDVLNTLHQEELAKIESELSDESKSIAMADYPRLHRLRKYQSLSEFQLENDMVYYQNKGLMAAYLDNLWANIAEYLSQKNGFEEVKEALFALESNADSTLPDITSYNKMFFPYFVDTEGELDGIDFDDAVKHFVKTSTRKELFGLGKKYDVTIPKYLRKSDLKERLLNILESNDKLDAQTKEQVEAATLKELRVLLEENNADSEPYITKEKMVMIIIDEVRKQRNHGVDEKPEVLLPVIGREGQYSGDLQEIIKNQQEIIRLLQADQPCEEPPKKFRMEVIYNYIIIILIIFVSLIWIFYGITTLF